MSPLVMACMLSPPAQASCCVHLMGHPEFRVREAATEYMIRTKLPAFRCLAEHWRQSPDPEVRTRIARVCRARIGYHGNYPWCWEVVKCEEDELVVDSFDFRKNNPKGFPIYLEDVYTIYPW